MSRFAPARGYGDPALRIVALIHLGRAKEARPSIKVLEAHNNHNRPELSALFAAVDYATEDYGAAVKHAQAATANMTEEESKNATTAPFA